MYDYQCQVERVVDGDTVRLLIDHGMYIRSSHAIRLAGVNAPELSTDAGKAAKDWVGRVWCSNHLMHSGPALVWPFHVVTEKDRQTFNRYIGIITCRSCGASLNDDVNAYLAAVTP